MVCFLQLAYDRKCKVCRLNNFQSYCGTNYVDTNGDYLFIYSTYDFLVIYGLFASLVTQRKQIICFAYVQFH